MMKKLRRRDKITIVILAILLILGIVWEALDTQTTTDPYGGYGSFIETESRK